MTTSRGKLRRNLLIAVIAVAALILAGATAVALPILTHQSVGGSGQKVPDGFVDEVSATGADGRARTLSATLEDGGPVDMETLVPGERIVVTGSGFDSAIGIYVAICGIPETAEEKPGPCLGGVPEGATEGTADTSALASAWVSDAWAWRAFATHGYSDQATGTFAVTLTVPAATTEGIDCRVDRCAIATRADHTASRDRVQDLLLPVRYAE